MSGMKRFLEDVMVDIGADEIDDDVLAEAQKRLDTIDKERNHCDFGHTTPKEIRRVPWQPGVENSGATLCCKQCYDAQVAPNQEDVPEWGDCEVIEPGWSVK